MRIGNSAKTMSRSCPYHKRVPSDREGALIDALLAQTQAPTTSTIDYTVLNGNDDVVAYLSSLTRKWIVVVIIHDSEDAVDWVFDRDKFIQHMPFDPGPAIEGVAEVDGRFVLMFEEEAAARDMFELLPSDGHGGLCYAMLVGPNVGIVEESSIPPEVP